MKLSRYALIEKMKNYLVDETEKAIKITAYNVRGMVVSVWVPKVAIHSKNIDGYICMKRYIAEENHLQYISPIFTPPPLDPNDAIICEDFDD